MRLRVFWGCVGAAGIVGISGGFAASEFLKQTRAPNMAASASECYAAAASANTELAADVMLYKCEKAFPDFLEQPLVRGKVEATAPRKADAALDIAPVHASHTTQDTDGYSEADLTVAALVQFESWIRDTLMRKMQVEFAERGLDIEDFYDRIATESLYLTVQGKKLALAKANIANTVRAVTLLGFNGRELNRVTCIRKSDHDIPLSSGPCAEEINKAFGVRITP